MSAKYFPSDTEKFISVTRDESVFILTMLNNENRFTKDFCSAICNALDYITETVDSEGLTEAAVVTTGGSEKFYSNGLDLQQIQSPPKFLDTVFSPFLSKILTFTLPTVACVNGHAFAGGMLMAMAHDYRVMRRDRGFICMNEIDMPATLPGSMSALLRYKLPPHVYRTVVLEGKRYNGAEAYNGNIVDAIPQRDGSHSALELAVAMAKKIAPKAKAGSIIQSIKQDMFPEANALILAGCKL